ncbi:hypothetical protein DL767_001777 [Monosporascus sp. MG133]|nr:hypothetical protein DL767_001777 [Monosporascus sp. MG133]
MVIEESKVQRATRSRRIVLQIFIVVIGSSQPAAPASASAAAAAVPQAPSVGGAAPGAERDIPIAGALADMLQDFAPEDVNRAYCTGFAELRANNRPKTDIGQAVFVCMEDQPSIIKLICAYSNRYMSNAASNFITHYDKPYANSRVNA